MSQVIVISYRHILTAMLGALLLGACGSDDRERLPGRFDRHANPVELLLDEGGRPLPSVLAQEQVLFRDNGEEPVTLDPHLAQGAPAAHILRDLFEGLTAESPEGRIIPGAAIRWNISRDGKTYTFYLRKDAKWSNGEPLVADDFVYGFRRSASPATASGNAQVLLPITNAAEVLSGAVSTDQLGVSAINDHILQITLNGPTPYFISLLNNSLTYPVYRPNVLEYASAFSRPGNLVSNGAYILKDWVLRSRIELVKNEHYWDAANVIINKVIYFPYVDQSAASKQFRAGKLHWTNGVPNNQFKWLQKHYPQELVINPWSGSFFFGFNMLREPFVASQDLRLALALALDRDLLTEKVTQFGELPSYTLVPPGIGEFVSPQPEWAEWNQLQRNAEARRLYASAGYSEDNPLRFEIRYDTGQNNKKMALAAASLWKQVLGVQATLRNEEPTVFLINREQKVITEVFRAGWISDYADPYSFLELFRTDYGRNDFGYSNQLFDSLLEEIAAERVPARRRRLMYEAERTLLTELPFIPVYTYVTKRLVNPRLAGWESNIMDHHYSKDMFLLKNASDTQGAAVNPESAAEVVPGTLSEEATREQEAGPPAAVEPTVAPPASREETITGADSESTSDDGGVAEGHEEAGAANETIITDRAGLTTPGEDAAEENDASLPETVPEDQENVSVDQNLPEEAHESADEPDTQEILDEEGTNEVQLSEEGASEEGASEERASEEGLSAEIADDPNPDDGSLDEDPLK